MKIIKHLIEDLREEMEGSEHYAKMALKYKDSDRDVADMFHKLSIVEKEHADMLHAAVVRKIKEKHAAGVETPAPMQVVYDWEHAKMVEAAIRLKSLQDMYKG